MKKTSTLFVIALVLAVGLGLAMSLGVDRHAPALAALPGQSQQGIYTVTFQSGVSPSGYDGAMDTFMDYYAQMKNEGGNTRFWVSSDGWRRALIKFDLSQHIPSGVHVLTATLALRVDGRTSSAPLQLVCYKVEQPWLEDEATWRERQEDEEWAGGGGCQASIREENQVCQVDIDRFAENVELDLTSIVQTWVDSPADNYGLLLKGEPLAGTVTYKFASADYGTPAYRPELTVVFQGAPPLATPTPTLTPTRTPTPPNPTVITSTLADWKQDICLKISQDGHNVKVAGPERMLLIWEGLPYTAWLRLIICNTNARHSIYLNGTRVGYTPELTDQSCECNMGPEWDGDLIEYEIDPNLVLQGANYITITNDGDVYDGWKASQAHIVMIGDITGTTRSTFQLLSSYDETGLRGAVQLPIGYDPAVATPLLISIPGTGEDKHDALNRYAIRANEMGWLLASLDLRKGWSSYLAKPAKSPSLAVQHDIIDLVQYMQDNYHVDQSRIYLAGFSAGGGIAATVAAKYPDVFAGVVEYAGPTDYASWYQERGDIRIELEREFNGNPTQNPFEYQRRSSRWLARNLQYVPMRIVHGTSDNTVPFIHAQNLFTAMGQFYDLSNKSLRDHPGGHVDWVDGVSETDLEFLSGYTLTRNPHALHIITDEGKSYYWLHVSKVGVTDTAWQGWVEIDASYDLNTNVITVTVSDGDFAEGKPITVTLDLAQMGLDTTSAYDVEEYDETTGDFSLHSAIVPYDGKLTLTVPCNSLGIVSREYVIYLTTGAELKQVRLQQDLDGYMGASDTYIVSDSLSPSEAATPHGDRDTLWLGYDGRRKCLLEFDLESVLPVLNNAVIKKAKLTLYLLQQRSVAINIGAYEARRRWLDTEATWTLATQEQQWTVAGADGLGSDRAATAEYTVQNVRLAGPYSFNLRSLLQRWLAVPGSNYGLVLIGSGPYTSAKYPLASAEYADTSKRPLLEISYMDPTPTPTATSTSTVTPTSTPIVTPSPTSTSTPTLTATRVAWYIYLPLILK